MQSIILRFLGFITIVSFLFTACKKEDIERPKPIPQPQPPVVSNQFKFILESLPGETVGSNKVFNALIYVVDKNNDTVIKNQILPIQNNGKYITSQLELPAGEYRLVRFRITNQNGQTKFAAPMEGSAKASEVNQPLSIAFTLPKVTTSHIPVEVAAVATTDIPQNFGYPAGSFEEQETESPDEIAFTKIKLQASVQIGDIIYEKIPASVSLTITGNNGQQTTKSIELAPGENEVALPKAASRFHFTMNKWGVAAEFFLDISQVREGELYGIVGSREAKKLKSEVNYKFANGQYVADSKIDYQYNRDGLLSRVDYFRKTTDGKPFIDTYEILHYTDGKITHIQKFDKDNNQRAEQFFTYDVMGKVKTILERNSVSYLNAVLTHFHTPNRFNTNIKYTYSHSDHTLDYNMIFLDGNLEKSTSASSLGSSEISAYQYDDAINPFAHLNRPDLYLSGQSKNNVVTQRSNYFGSSPQTYPYKFDYTYDNDGYPSEVIKSYKVPATNAHAYTLKTVYTYL